MPSFSESVCEESSRSETVRLPPEKRRWSQVREMSVFRRWPRGQWMTAIGSQNVWP
jgi:hypothetical protein